MMFSTILCLWNHICLHLTFMTSTLFTLCCNCINKCHWFSPTNSQGENKVFANEVQPFSSPDSDLVNKVINNIHKHTQLHLASERQGDVIIPGMIKGQILVYDVQKKSK